MHALLAPPEAVGLSWQHLGAHAGVELAPKVERPDAMPLVSGMLMEFSASFC